MKIDKMHCFLSQNQLGSLVWKSNYVAEQLLNGFPSINQLDNPKNDENTATCCE
jgi:hypothetical protein